MSFESLPSELYNEIISYLWDDKVALAACSLASKALTIPSQKLLFSQIILVHNNNIPSGGTASSFWHNVLRISPHIAGYVQCLQLINDYLGRWISCDTFLPRILPLHTHLKALVVSSITDWRVLPANIQRAFQDVIGLPSLVHLDLSFDPAFRFSQHFNDNLKHLVIHFNNNHTLPPFKSSAPPIYLESLFLMEAGRLPLSITEPNCRFKFNHLRKLWFDMDADSNRFSGCRQLSELLLSCRETLEELRLSLHINFIEDMHLQSPPFDLSLMASLKVVTLRMAPSKNRGVDWPPSTCLKFLLCSGSSPYRRLEEIVVVFQTTQDNGSDWDKVSTFFLDEYRCPLLRKLSVYYAMHDSLYDICTTSVNDSENTEKLRARRGMEVIVAGGNPGDYWNFALDEQWNNVTFQRYFHRELLRCEFRREQVV